LRYSPNMRKKIAKKMGGVPLTEGNNLRAGKKRTPSGVNAPVLQEKKKKIKRGTAQKKGQLRKGEWYQK